eukprot:5577578-Pyramimonas_sp.AAC.1
MRLWIRRQGGPARFPGSRTYQSAGVATHSSWQSAESKPPKHCAPVEVRTSARAIRSHMHPRARRSAQAARISSTTGARK